MDAEYCFRKIGVECLIIIFQIEFFVNRMTYLERV